ncbi:MAG: orotidine-5'-phosphate decarboxylase [Oscillospiraceae bacterium]
MCMDLLIDKIKKFNNPTVVGLDPDMDYIPQFIKKKSFALFGETLEGAADAIFNFNKYIIDSIFDIVPAIKPQCAYYEMYGYHGVKALYDTINYAKNKGMYVIIDGKRNDIGSTMLAYSNAYLGKVMVSGNEFEPFSGDSLTVNGYLGVDSIYPLIDNIKKYNKTIFLLVKTSNPSSCDLQDISLGDKTIYQLVGDMCQKWGNNVIGKHGFSSVGAVVGATYPDKLKELRSRLNDVFFLIPGYGAQGGSAKDIKNAFNKDGLGAIVNSSRGIICAYKNFSDGEANFDKYIRNASIYMRDDILSVLD